MGERGVSRSFVPIAPIERLPSQSHVPRLIGQTGSPNSRLRLRTQGNGEK